VDHNNSFGDYLNIITVNIFKENIPGLDYFIKKEQNSIQRVCFFKLNVLSLKQIF
jgi:hypothetical protein